MRPWFLLGVLVVAVGGGILALLAVNQGQSPSPTRPSVSFPPSPTTPALPPPSPGTSFSDFVVDPTVVQSPTTSTAQSKLWFADGAWWGALVGPTTHRLGIFRLDPETQVWADTGAIVDERAFADADALWTGENLYTVAGGSRPSDNHAIRLRRFTYDAKTRLFTMDPDFPVTIRGSGASPAVIAADSTGMVWVTYVADGRVWLSHTVDHDAVWSEPAALPAAEATVDLADVATLVAFGPGQLGVMWTNQQAGVFFSAHRDGTPDRRVVRARTGHDRPASR